MSCLRTAERAVGPIFIRPSGVLAAGEVVPGHRHHFDHATILFSGSVRVVADGEAAEYHAPAEWATPKEAEHEITALEDGTVFYCVFPHRTPRGEVTRGYAGFEESYR